MTTRNSKGEQKLFPIAKSRLLGCGIARALSKRLGKCETQRNNRATRVINVCVPLYFLEFGKHVVFVNLGRMMLMCFPRRNMQRHASKIIHALALLHESTRELELGNWRSVHVKRASLARLFKCRFLLSLKCSKPIKVALDANFGYV